MRSVRQVLRGPQPGGAQLLQHPSPFHSARGLQRSAAPLLIRASSSRAGGKDFGAKEPGHVTLDCVATLGPHPDAASVVISSNRQFAMSMSPHPQNKSTCSAKVWDLDAKASVFVLEFDNWFVPLSVAVAPAVQMAAPAGADPDFWPATFLRAVFGSGERIRVLDIGHRGFSRDLPYVGQVPSLAISANGLHVASSSPDKLQVWSVDPGACIMSLEGFTGRVQAVAVTADERHAMIGTNETELQLWDLNQGACVATLHEDHQCMQSVAVTADQQYVVAGNAELDQLKVWRLQEPGSGAKSSTGSLIATLKGAVGLVKAVTVAENGRLILTVAHMAGTGEEQLQMWDV